MRWLALALVARSATTTTCPGTIPTDDTPSPVAGCSFDADWCGWNNTSSEGTRWTLGTGTTPTRFTGARALAADIKATSAAGLIAATQGPNLMLALGLPPAVAIERDACIDPDAEVVLHHE